MKKQLLILAIIMIFAIPLHSQIGIKGGPILSDIIFLVKGQTPYLGYEINSLTHKLPYLTYQFGIFKKFKINSRIDFQLELLLAKKGLDYSSDYLYDDITYILKINYIEAPLLFKYDIGKKNKFGLLAGPYGSYMINTERIREFEGKLVKDKMSNVRKFDFGIVASLSYDIIYNDNQFNLDFRTTYSLINMMDYLDGYVLRYYGSEEERARNVNIALTLGYYFSTVNHK